MSDTHTPRKIAEEIATRMVLAIPTEIDKASIVIGPPQDGDEFTMKGWSLYTLVSTEQMAKKCEREVRGWIADAIEQALANREKGPGEVPKGFVRTDDQVDRRVLGTLAMTEDGLVIGHNCQLWEWIESRDAGQPGLGFGKVQSTDDSDEYPLGKFYSTRDALLSARESAQQSTTQGEV